jgi:hypothetical protein
MSLSLFPRTPELPLKLAELIVAAAVEMARDSQKAFRISDRGRGHGATLRPGRETPLWNELRAQLRPYLKKYGEQANLARVLGLPRQRINDFVTGGAQMPDAERTLQLLAWLMAARHQKRPL